MKCYVKREKCNGCGLCACIMSEVFTIDSNGKAYAKNIELSETQIEGIILHVESSCPAYALYLR